MKLLHSVARAPALLVIVMVRLYQRTVSRIMPRTCKFTPSCSNYMIQAIRAHGLLRGVALGTWRILRCNPFSRGGYDPVPGQRQHEIVTEPHRQKKDNSDIYE